MRAVATITVLLTADVSETARLHLDGVRTERREEASSCRLVIPVRRREHPVSSSRMSVHARLQSARTSADGGTLSTAALPSCGYSKCHGQSVLVGLATY